jgi:hypothetical protein
MLIAAAAERRSTPGAERSARDVPRAARSLDE